jgi:NDP-sugar pyrophosphorylase family protein
MSLPTLAILAGGLATRLRPITATIPKSLVEVNGEPFLAHQLRLAYAQGFRRVVLLIGHLGEQIERFAGDGSLFGLAVQYARDGESLRGAGGALRAACGRFGEHVVTLYGDSYLDIEVEPVWAAYRASGADALMTVLHNRDRWDRSNVRFDGRLVLSHDKQSLREPGVEWIDFGLSIFRTDVIANWPAPDPFDLSELTKRLAAERRLAGYPVTQRFYEIGGPRGLSETDAYLRARAQGRATAFSNSSSRTRRDGPVSHFGCRER